MTSIRVNDAATEYDNDGNLWLTFKVAAEDRTKARGVERVMTESDKQQAITFGKYKKKRSLDANAYYWVMCGKLAEAMHITTQEVYRNHIRDIGNYEVYCMKTEAVTDFNKLWCSTMRADR